MNQDLFLYLAKKKNILGVPASGQRNTAGSF